MTYEQARIQIQKAARDEDATPATIRKAEDAVLAHLLRKTYRL